MIPAPAAADDPLLWETDRPRPERPALVTGFQGWGVLGGDGEFRWVRETRGAPHDWGGVYVHGIRLTGPWTLAFSDRASGAALAPEFLHLGVRRSRVTVLRRAPEFDLAEEVLLPPHLPGVARELSIASRVDRPLALGIGSRIRPYLAPVLVEGLKPYEYDLGPLHGRLRVRAVGASLLLDADAPVRSVALDGTPWDGSHWTGALGRIDHDYHLDLPPRGTARLRLLLWGGIDSSIREEELLEIPGGWGASEAWVRENAAVWNAWTEATPGMRLPDAPEIEQGYALARGALRSLYVYTEPGLQGLRAGYPWYGDVWGRDLAWALPAVLWMNDAPWAEAAIRSLFGFQSPGDLPLLAATMGELPMQLSPGPIFLYGTSDTSIYFFDRLRRVLAHTGDPTGIRRDLRGGIELLRGWLERKRDPANGLVTNGGEADRMRALASAGRRAYGIDSPDMTIWDAADRRDHAIDLQVLAVEAERSYAALAEAFGDPVAAAAARGRAEALAAMVRARYLWPEEGYLYDALRKDGTPVLRLRPNALLAVQAGLLPEATARGVLGRALQSDLLTPWGMRTLSSRDPGYDPLSYHEGQVWPIATAWAAQASLLVGERERGVELLRILARAYLEEGGLANECYRGDQPLPWNSSCLLGFSVAPFLTTLFEGLWGIVPDLLRRRVTVDPRFPEGWTEAELTRLRLAEGELGLRWRKGELTATWTGSAPLEVVGPNGPVPVTSGRSTGGGGAPGPGQT
jgi:hypothetical protein